MDHRAVRTLRIAPVALLALHAFGCMGTDGVDDVDLEESGDALTHTVNGTRISGSDALIGEWQVPFCAGGIPRSFATYAGEAVRFNFAADGSYEATRPSAQLGEPCAIGGRCLSVEVGTYAVRTPVDERGRSLGDRLVLRPANGTPREYIVSRSQTISLSPPSTVVTPGAVPGALGGGYPRSLLFADICHECADSQEKLQAIPGNRATWTCRDRAGIDRSPAPEVIASVTGSAIVDGAGSATVEAPADAVVRGVRIEGNFVGDTYNAEIALVHDGVEAVVLRYGTSSPLTLSTTTDAFFGASAAGTWSIVTRRRNIVSTQPLPSAESFRLILTR